MSICDLRLNTGKRPDNRNSEILNRNSFYRRVPPGEYSLTSSDGDPGTNGVISKTRCGAWNKDPIRDFASAIWSARTCPRFKSGDMSPHSKKGRSPRTAWPYRSITSSGNSFAFVDLFGKCAASNL